MLRIYRKFKTEHVIPYFTQLPDNRDQARAYEIKECCENSVYDEVLGPVYNPLDVDQLCPPSVCGLMGAAIGPQTPPLWRIRYGNSLSLYAKSQQYSNNYLKL